MGDRRALMHLTQSLLAVLQEDERQTVGMILTTKQTQT